MLFLLAVAPRVWAPDLVPYGTAQARLVGEAAARSAVSWPALYTEPSIPLLALLDLPLRVLPAPVGTWVVLRGLLDALGVAMLYLAVARLLDRPSALLAALLYALNPVAWAAARDPAGTLAPPLVALVLLVSVWLVRRPTPARGIVLGLALAAIVRSAPLGWGFVLAGALTLAVARASWVIGCVAGLALMIAAGPAILVRPLIPSFDVASAGRLGWQGLMNLGGLTLPDLVVPAAALGALLAAVAIVVAAVWAWHGQLRLLVLPIWAVVVLLWPSIVGDAGLLPAALPALAALVVVPVGVKMPAAVRWAVGVAVALLVTVSALGILLTQGSAEAAERDGRAFDTLRGWQALAATARQTADRVGTSEVAVLDGADMLTPTPMLESLLRDRLTVRHLPPDTWTLPLEHEALFLLMPGTPIPVELTRPSSRLAVTTPAGTDTGARLATLQPRPAIDWLARADPIPGGRFADGSSLDGVAVDRRAAGTLALTLFWELPTADAGRPAGRTVRLTAPGSSPVDAPLPPLGARRGGEIVVQAVSIALPGAAQRDPPVSVALLDATGQPIPNADGATEVSLLPAGS